MTERADNGIYGVNIEALHRDIARLRAENERLEREIEEVCEHAKGLRDEYARYRIDKEAQLTAARAALIDARDTFGGDEDEDRYWAWFNRHEDTAFAGLPDKRTEDGDG